MPFYATLASAVEESLREVYLSVAGFLPLLLGALFVFIIGWIVAVSVGKLVEQLIKALRVDQFLSHLEIEKAIEKSGWKLNSGAFIGGLVKWFLIIVFLLAAVNVLGERFAPISQFLVEVLTYLPNVIVAALILVIAALVADTVEKVIKGSVEAAGYNGALVGVVARWSIWVFALLAALMQLKIAEDVVRTLVTGLVYGAALAFAIAFGLGGKDAAAGFIEKVKNDLRR